MRTSQVRTNRAVRVGLRTLHGGVEHRPGLGARVAESEAFTWCLSRFRGLGRAYAAISPVVTRPEPYKGSPQAVVAGGGLSQEPGSTLRFVMVQVTTDPLPTTGFFLIPFWSFRPPSQPKKGETAKTTYVLLAKLWTLPAVCECHEC